MESVVLLLSSNYSLQSDDFVGDNAGEFYRKIPYENKKIDWWFSGSLIFC